MSAFLAATAVAHTDPPGCFQNGVGLSFTVYRSDGTTPITGGETVQSGETVVYETVLSDLPGDNCTFGGGPDGFVTITTPDGMVHTLVTPGDVPHVTDGGSFTAPSQSYVVSEADVVSGQLPASTEYGDGISHTGGATEFEPAGHDTAGATANRNLDYEDVALEVSKTATPAFDEECTWDVTKTGDITDHGTLETGQSGTTEYTIEVDQIECVQTNHRVEGDITIHNPAEFASASVSSITDELSGGIVATIFGCDTPGSLAPGQTLVCPYSADLPDDSFRINYANVTTTGDVDGGETTEEVDFTGVNPTNCIDCEVDADDSFEGFLGSFSGDGSVSYTRTFECDGDQGTHENIVQLFGDEPGVVLAEDNEFVTLDCTTPQLVVTKDADTSFDRECDWTITKTVDNATHDLGEGEAANSTYTITLDKTCSDTNHQVNGTINVTNPADSASAEVESVEDHIEGAGANAAVDCGDVTFPHTLGPGESFECTYVGSVPDDATRTNTAWANVTVSSDVTGGQGSAEASFDGVEPTTITNDEATVDDTNNAGDAGPFSDDTEYSYTVEFRCGDDEGENPNTADVFGDDANTPLDSDSALVTVTCPTDVVCGFTQGFWKNHGPPTRKSKGNQEDVWPYENMPEVDGEKGLFLGDVFYTAEELMELFNTPTKGDASMILAHQLIAAKLNVANGSTVPDDVADAITEADDLLTQANAESPKDALPFNIKKGDLANDLVAVSETLDAYNNGLLTRGCTPDLSVTKEPESQLIGFNGTAAWTINVTNSAGVNVEAEDVTVTDTLPEGFAFNATASSAACSETDPGIVTCDLGKLQPGETATVTIAADSNPDHCDQSHTNTVEAWAKDEADGINDQEDNEATATVHVACLI